MRKDRSENGNFCTYCGEKFEAKEENEVDECEFCGSGKEWLSVEKGECDDYYWNGFNNIDNILEDKRSGRHSSK